MRGHEFDGHFRFLQEGDAIAVAAEQPLPILPGDEIEIAAVSPQQQHGRLFRQLAQLLHDHGEPFLRCLAAQSLERIVLLLVGAVQMLDIQAGIGHHEIAAGFDQTGAETPSGGDLEHAGLAPLLPQLVEIKDQPDVASREPVDRLPIVAHAEQREVPLFAQRSD